MASLFRAVEIMAAFTPKLPFIKMKRMLAILFLLVCCYCEVFVVYGMCDADQIAIKKSSNGTIECRPCPNCPEGHGLAVKCGSTTDNVALLKCIPCVAGVNYSNSHDHSMCTPCRHCDPHQNKTGQCTQDKDETVCGKCLRGYYEEVTGSCKKCTWCCKGENPSRRMPDCVHAGLPENKQCAQDGPSESCAPRGTHTENYPLSVEKIIIAIVVSVIVVAVIVAIVVFLYCFPAKRERLKSICIKWFQHCPCRSQPSEQPSSCSNYENMNFARGRHRPSLQNSWPATTFTNNETFNPKLLSSNQAKNSARANATVSANGPLSEPDGMSEDRVEATKPFQYSKMNSYPGYPIKSDDMYGPRKSLFHQMHEWRRNKTQKKKRGFEKFQNEDYGGGSSGSGQQHSLQDHRVPNGDCSSEHRMTHGAGRSDMKMNELDYRNNPDRHQSLNDPSSNEERSSVATNDARVGQPVAPHAVTFSSHNRNGTDRNLNPSVRKALQSVGSNQCYSPERLNKKASEIPYQVLRKLCPKMDKRRDFDFEDYRMMGELMGLDKNTIESVEGHSHPTKYLLNKYGSRGGTIGEVMAVLISMQRQDAFEDLEEYCLKSFETCGSEML